MNGCLLLGLYPACNPCAVGAGQLRLVPSHSVSSSTGRLLELCNPVTSQAPSGQRLPAGNSSDTLVASWQGIDAFPATGLLCPAAWQATGAYSNTALFSNWEELGHQRGHRSTYERRGLSPQRLPAGIPRLSRPSTFTPVSTGAGGMSTPRSPVPRSMVAMYGR